MKSILILQNEIKAYRKPVYNGLSADYDVIVLHSGRPSVDKDDRYHEVILPKKLIWRFHLQPQSRLKKAISESDVVIAMFDLSWPSYLVPLYWRVHPKYILWGHWYSTNAIVNWVRNTLMKKADRLLMYGEEEVPRIIRSGIPPERVIIAPNTVHVPEAVNFSTAKKKSLLFIGRLQAESRRNSKRADILIETFARIQSSIRNDININIVGDGNEKKSLMLLAKELGVADKVIFHGHIDDSDILSELFSESIALVSPGHVGLSVLESFGHGVPVVTGKAVNYRRESQHLLNLLTGSKVIMGPEYYNIHHEHNSLLASSFEDLDLFLIKLCNEPGYAAQLGTSAFEYYASQRPLSRMLEGIRKAIEE